MMNKYSGTADFSERNTGIVLDIIRGHSAKEVGHFYGISAARVQQVVTRWIRTRYPNHFQYIKTDNGYLVSLTKLREKYQKYFKVKNEHNQGRV